MLRNPAYQCQTGLFILSSILMVAGRSPVETGAALIPPTRPLRLRGGFNAVNLISAQQQQSLTPARAIEPQPYHQIDESLLQGDVARLNHGYRMALDDFEELKKQHEEASYQYHMTQQFLVLQNQRIESQLPGGDNCSYADSWFTGELWDRVDDDMKWTRSAWLQCQRAKCWEEMPAIWKRIMRENWEELQEFMAIVALPDGGRSSRKFQAHVQAWEAMRAAFLSNMNRAVHHMTAGPLQENIAKQEKAAKEILDVRNSEQRTMPLWDWLYYQTARTVRKVLDKETEQDKIEQHRPTEVQLFGVPVFNTKDAVSDRIWSAAAAQGDTMFVYPLKAVAWASQGETIFVYPLKAVALGGPSDTMFVYPLKAV